MDEHEFDVMADIMLEALELALEAESGGLDFEVKQGGIIEIEFEDGSKVIVNKHRAAREIWVAARSGGFHFRPEAGRWLGTRDGCDLLSALSRCLSDQAGRPINLA